MFQSIIALTEEEVGIALIDYWTIFHLFVAFVFYIILVFLIRNNAKRMKASSKKNDNPKRRTVRASPQIGMKIKNPLLIGVFFLTIILGIIWEFVDYMFPMFSFNAQDTLYNSTFDILFNVIGAGLAFMLWRWKLKSK